MGNEKRRKGSVIDKHRLGAAPSRKSRGKNSGNSGVRKPKITCKGTESFLHLKRLPSQIFLIKKNQKKRITPLGGFLGGRQVSPCRGSPMKPLAGISRKKKKFVKRERLLRKGGGGGRRSEKSICHEKMSEKKTRAADEAF